jgi:hypothetical protein
VNRIRIAIVALLLIFFVGAPQVELFAQGRAHGHHGRQEQKLERRRLQRARQTARIQAQQNSRILAQQNRALAYNSRVLAQNSRAIARQNYWDAARYYRADSPTATRIVLGTTLVGLLTIPLWLQLGAAFVGLQ